jgi:predicted TPR repeat methyltransferase
MVTKKTTTKKVPPKKNTPPTAVQNVVHDVGLMLGETKKQLWDFVRDLDKMRTIQQNNYQLGHHHLRLGNVSDAVLRFKFVTWLNPMHFDAFYYLACSYLASDKKKQACDAFKRALILKPDYEEASYMLALAGGEDTKAAFQPKRMPLKLAKEYFDSQATTYNHEQLEVQGYDGHRQLANAIRAVLVPSRTDHVILDLGSGTGLCGSLMRDVAVQLNGVDIAPAMVTEALKLTDKEGNKIYNALIRQDIQSYLKGSAADTYDIVMSADTFNYLGDLKEVFSCASNTLKSSGLFAFTADKIEDVTNKTGYMFDHLRSSFRFSQAYLEGLAEENGLKSVKITSVDTYPGNASWLCIYKK